MTSGSRVLAALDLGSTSAHLLVAALDGSRVSALLDASAFLGLGASVDERSTLGVAKIAELVAAVRDAAASAAELGAEPLVAVGTEPLRRARDAPAAVAAVRAGARVDVHVLAHEEEGLLTLLGATAGGRPDGPLVLVDVGGGSSEVVVAAPNRRPGAAGIALGAERLTRQVGPSDPPSAADVEALLRTARAAIERAAPPPAPSHRVSELIAVGGTSEKIGDLVAGRDQGEPIDPAGLHALLGALTRQPAAALAERHGLRPGRARILPAGIAIVLAFTEHYAAERVRVSRSGLREGLVRAVGGSGVAWRDALPHLAGG